MEGAELENFNKLKPSTIPMENIIIFYLMKFIRMLSLMRQIFVLLFNFFFFKMIAPFLTTMWYNPYCCAKQYRYASAIYIPSYLALEFSIIIDRSVVSPGHGKDVVYGLNSKYNHMLKVSMSKLLNPEFNLWRPIFSQFHAGSWKWKW